MELAEVAESNNGIHGAGEWPRPVGERQGSAEGLLPGRGTPPPASTTGHPLCNPLHQGQGKTWGGQMDRRTDRWTDGTGIKEGQSSLSPTSARQGLSARVLGVIYRDKHLLSAWGDLEHSTAEHIGAPRGDRTRAGVDHTSPGGDELNRAPRPSRWVEPEWIQRWADLRAEADLMNNLTTARPLCFRNGKASRLLMKASKL